MEWAASVETSSNQPVLPYAILVLNFCENNIPAKLWEVDTATKVLLGSLAETVDRNPSFKLFAKAWRARGAKIETVEDLLMCYYSSLKVRYSLSQSGFELAIKCISGGTNPRRRPAKFNA